MKDGRTGKTKPMPQRPNQMSPNGGSVLGDERTGYRSGDRSLRAGGAKSPIPIDLERGFLCDLMRRPDAGTALQAALPLLRLSKGLFGSVMRVR